FEDRVEVAVGDLRRPDTLPEVVAGVTQIICATGTTAFPSKKWDADFEDDLSGLPSVLAWGRIYWDGDYRRRHTRNRPEHIDGDGVANLVAVAQDLQRFVFVSSVGIERKDQLPFSILNAFGVLDAKQRGEKAIISSGLPYTIIRPGRLTDGPYTSYDLNTLLQAKTSGDQDVVIGTGDELNGQASRIDVAAACVACLSHGVTENQIFELVNQGTRPAQFSWGDRFQTLLESGRASSD
ncbi:NAD(P)-dependent oxidoreductase, partial [filamentous cyanobacterium CCP5]